MNVGRINSFEFNKKLSFGKEEKAEEKTAAATVDDDDDDDDEDESFYERHKGVINAIGVIGAAGIAVAAYKHLKPKKFKNEVKMETTNPVSPINSSLKIRDIMADLKGKSDDEMAASLKAHLTDSEPHFKFKLIDDLLTEDYCYHSKYANSKTWELMLDNLMTLKPDDKIKPENIQKNADRIFEMLAKYEFLTPEIINKIIAKMPGMSKEIRVLAASRLVNSSCSEVSSKIVEPTLTQEQVKKVLEHIKGIGDNDIHFKDSWLQKERNVPSDVKSNLYAKYFEQSSLDSAEDLNFLREVLADKGLTSETKFKLISKLDNLILGHTMSKRDAVKTLVRGLADIEEDFYETDDVIVKRCNYTNLKFVLGENLIRMWRFDPKTDNLHEYLGILDKFIKSAKTVRCSGVADSTSSALSTYLETLMREKISVQTSAFREKYKTTNPSYGDLNDFVDDVFAQIHDMKFEANMWNSHVRTTLANAYKDVCGNVCDMLNEPSFVSSYEKNGELRKKLSDFGKKHFGFGYKDYSSRGGYGYDYSHWSSGSGAGGGRGYGSGYGGGYGSGYGSGSGGSYGSHSSGRSSGSSGSSGKTGGFGGGISEVGKAKQTILKYLREKEELKELADQFENQEMDKDLFKSVKRRLSLAYHPDRAGRDEKLAEQNTEIYKKISDALDVIEKRL